MSNIWNDPYFLLAISYWCRLFIIWRKRQHKKRKFWVRPINKNRPQQGDFMALFQELKDDTIMFFRYTRMTVNTFYNLLELIAPALQKSHWRAISPEQRLSVTLRYLATGDQVLSIAFAYRIGESTAYVIIKETTKAIVNVLLSQFVQPPSETEYKEITAGYLENWNFPNCLGSVDGKHCIIRAPLRSGSLYYNYKKTFSVVLMAACGHNYKFTLVDVGSYGSQNDANIFSESEFGKSFKKGKLNVPKGKFRLPGSDELTEYFFIGDEAFPLSTNFMRLFPGRNLDEKKRIFNYRLSRAKNYRERIWNSGVSLESITKTNMYAA